MKNDTLKTTYTPGPWVFKKYSLDTETRDRMRKLGMNDEADQLAVSNEGQAYVMAEAGRVALVDCRVDFKRGKGYLTECSEREANAALIAAAPELLEACKMFDALEESCKDKGLLDISAGDLLKAYRAARAAIAKATTIPS
jgi:hypothetical protein